MLHNYIRQQINSGMSRIMLLFYINFRRLVTVILSSLIFFRKVFRLIPNKSAHFAWLPPVASNEIPIKGNSSSFKIRLYNPTGGKILPCKSKYRRRCLSISLDSFSVPAFPNDASMSGWFSSDCSTSVREISCSRAVKPNLFTTFCNCLTFPGQL